MLSFEINTINAQIVRRICCCRSATSTVREAFLPRNNQLIRAHHLRARRVTSRRALILREDPVPRRCQSCVCPSLSGTWSYPPVSSKRRRCRRREVRRAELLLTSRIVNAVRSASSSRIQAPPALTVTARTYELTRLR